MNPQNGWQAWKPFKNRSTLYYPFMICTWGRVSEAVRPNRAICHNFGFFGSLISVTSVTFNSLHLRPNQGNWIKKILGNFWAFLTNIWRLFTPKIRSQWPPTRCLRIQPRGR